MGEKMWLLKGHYKKTEHGTERRWNSHKEDFNHGKRATNGLRKADILFDRAFVTIEQRWTAIVSF